MMFYEYLSRFHLSDFSSVYVIVKIHDEDSDFNELIPLLSIFSYDVDLLFDFNELFNNFTYSSISHLITDSGKSLVLQVVVYE